MQNFVKPHEGIYRNAGTMAAMSTPTPALPPRGASLDAPRLDLDVPGVGRLAVYVAGPDEGVPLLLVHSVNAAASAYEWRPIFDRYRATRRVVALDLPGFGASDRSGRAYTPRLMTDAVLAVAHHLTQGPHAPPIDALALSLGCEFLARAAAEQPALFRSVGLVSPTGFGRRGLRLGAPGTVLGKPGVVRFLTQGRFGRGAFRLLTRRPVVRYFLRRTFGQRAVDPGLVEQAFRSAQAPGAEHAPLHFLSAALFSADSGHLYRALQGPVFVVHGIRGDFVDYDALDAFKHDPRWQIEVMATGALPYFEHEADFAARYEAFLARSVATTA
jgi:pimeloyl-ACP methyl ester carboxylesterase